MKCVAVPTVVDVSYCEMVPYQETIQVPVYSGGCGVAVGGGCGGYMSGCGGAVMASGCGGCH